MCIALKERERDMVQKRKEKAIMTVTSSIYQA